MCLCVNLTKPWGAHYFWVHLWGCFYMRLALESVAWMKQPALPSVYGPHPSLKSHIKQQSRGGKNSLSVWLLRIEHWSSSAQTGTCTLSFCGFHTFRLGLGLFSLAFWASSLQTAHVGLLLYNHVSQFLRISLSPYTHTQTYTHMHTYT